MLKPGRVYSRTNIKCIHSLQLFSAGCGPPPQIANGTAYEFGGTAVGSTAYYYCNAFRANLVGNRNILCQEDGRWEDPPMCVLPGESIN